MRQNGPPQSILRFILNRYVHRIIIGFLPPSFLRITRSKLPSTRPRSTSQRSALPLFTSFRQQPSVEFLRNPAKCTAHALSFFSYISFCSLPIQLQLWRLTHGPLLNTMPWRCSSMKVDAPIVRVFHHSSHRVGNVQEPGRQSQPNGFVSCVVFSLLLCFFSCALFWELDFFRHFTIWQRIMSTMVLVAWMGRLFTNLVVRR